jgi:hypothetical protein
MSKADAALAVGILAAFGGLGYWLYKKGVFNFDKIPSVPVDSDTLAERDEWTKTKTDTTTTPQGDTIINYIIEGSGAWDGFQFESQDINPNPTPNKVASGDKIIGETSQGNPIYETTTGYNPVLSDPTQYPGYIGNSTPQKVKSSSSSSITVKQAEKDSSGLTATDKLIAKNKGMSEDEYKSYYYGGLAAI